MTRPVSTRIAGCLATGLLSAGLAIIPGPPSALAAEPTSLRVSIDSMSPSTIPADGTITVTGQVTNRSEETWTDLNVYLLTSAAPFTTHKELAQAQLTAPDTEIGNRLTEAELYDTVGDLAPGASTPYRLSVPRKDLEVTGEAGVYWLGVHVLGANEDGRVIGADGRSRTIIPLMERSGPQTAMALVMPMKAGVRRDPMGRLENLRNWQDLIRPEGRLGRVLRLSRTSPDIALTWVLDPAVLDAATSVATGNPPISIAPTDGGADSDPETSGDSPSPSPSKEASGDSSDDSSTDRDPPVQSEAAQQATKWLNRFRRQAAQRTVLTLPYGDLDVAAVLRHDLGDLFAQATELSAQTMEGFGIVSGPIVAPAPGFLPANLLPTLDPATPVLLSDAAAPDASRTVLETERGVRIVLTESSAAAGGPSRTASSRALALRQRILSQSALHALSEDRTEPLVVSTPQLWDPGAGWRQADFLSGLDAPWLRTVGLPTVIATAGPSDPATDQDAVRLSYPPAQARAELSLPNVLASQELAETGELFANLLTQNDTVDESLAKSAMLASNYRSREHRNLSVVMAAETSEYVRSLMARVRIEAPSFVTMSSKEGPFGITLVNGLEEPVTVGINAETGSSELVIPSPEPVSLGPLQRASVRLRATSEDIGLHSVSLVPTDRDGSPVGSPVTFNVRSSQVGLVIWVIIGLGAAVLFSASGVRIIRRLRSGTSSRDPLPGAPQ